jgi:hypothetical protein
MELKIDTKEKYQLLTPAGTLITANIAAEIVAICNNCTIHSFVLENHEFN